MIVHRLAAEKAGTILTQPVSITEPELIIQTLNHDAGSDDVVLQGRLDDTSPWTDIVTIAGTGVARVFAYPQVRVSYSSGSNRVSVWVAGRPPSGGASILIGDVVGLQDELDDKSNVGHTHVKADVTDFAHTHSAADLTSGTVPDGRFPATLPAVSGANLTSLNASSIASGTLAEARLPTGIDAAKISGGNVSNTEFDHLNGVTSALQTQIDGKSATGHTHALNTLTGLAFARLSSDVTTTSASMVDVTGLSFSIAANEVWTFEFYLFLGATSATAQLHSLTVPASATFHMSVVGNTSTLDGHRSHRVNTADADGPLLHSIALDFGYARMAGYIANSTNAGTVQLRFRSNSGGSTVKILAGSYMVARRISP